MKTDRKKLIVAVSAVSAALVAILVFLFMFLPLWSRNPVKNTAEELVGDIDWIGDLAESLEDRGYKITANGNFTARVTELMSAFDLEYTEYGRKDGFRSAELELTTPTKELTLSVISDDRAVAIGGYDEDGGYLLFPKENIIEALDSSILNPENDSIYALDQDSYESLCDYFEEDESDSRLVAELEHFLERVIERSERIVKPESKIRFAKGAFRLERVITYTVTSENILDIIDVIEEELDAAEELSASLTAMNYTDILKGIRESVDGLNLTLSYTVSRSMISAFNIKVNSGSFETARTDEIDFVLTDSGFVMTGHSDFKEEGNPVRDEFKVEYNRSDNSRRTEVELCAESIKTVTDKRGITETKTDDFTLTFDYDKRSGAYELNMPIEGDRPAVFKGSFKKESFNKGLHFTLDEMIVFDLPRNSERIFEFHAERSREADGMTLPEGSYLLNLEDDDAGSALRDLPIKTIDEIVGEIIGTPLGFSYTTDGILLVMTEELKNEYDKITKAYIKYLNGNLNGNRYDKKVRYYSDSCHKYILLSFNPNNGMVTVEFAHSLSSDQNEFYRPVSVEYDRLVFK